MPDVFIADNENKAADQNNNQTNTLENNDVLQKAAPPIALKTGNRVHIFSSFCQYPEDITFQNQDDDETVLLFIRRAFITNVGWISIGVFLIILPIVFSAIQKSLSFSINILPVSFIIVFLAFYYLVILTYLYISFITWYFNISLVTDKRIVDVDFSNLVYKNVAATKLNLVQDVSFSQVGVIRTFFDYGDILVQTAGTLDNFEFNASPQPENVVHIIGGLIGGKGSGL